MNVVKWEITEVWYASEYDVWMITAYDDEGNQVGDSEYEYGKIDAEDTAQAYLDSDRCERVRIKGEDGMIQRVYGKRDRLFSH